MMIAASFIRVAAASSEPSAALCERTAVNYLQQCLIKQRVDQQSSQGQREDEILYRTSSAECWPESQAVYDACQQSLLQSAAQNGDLAASPATPTAKSTTSTAPKTSATNATSHSAPATSHSTPATSHSTTHTNSSTTHTNTSTTPSANSTREQERVREARRIREIM